MSSSSMKLVPVTAAAAFLVIAYLSGPTVVFAAAGNPSSDPISELTSCLTDCGSNATACALACTKQGMQMPVCIANCAKDDITCMFSCVHIPIIPTPPPAPHAVSTKGVDSDI